MIVYLVGMPGSGKSTVGAELAGRLGVPFIDLDDEIARDDGRGITEIFAAEGEAGFRAREAKALVGASTHDPAVIACGGGVVLEPANRITLRSSGTCVFLDVPLEVLAGACPAQRGSPADPRAGRPRATVAGARAALPGVRRPRGRWERRPGRGRGRDRGGAPLERVTVPIPGRSYEVVIGAGVIDDAAGLLPDLDAAATAFIVVDQAIGGQLAPTAGGRPRRARSAPRWP